MRLCGQRGLRRLGLEVKWLCVIDGGFFQLHMTERGLESLSKIPLLLYLQRD